MLRTTPIRIYAPSDIQPAAPPVGEYVGPATMTLRLGRATYRGRGVVRVRHDARPFLTPEQEELDAREQQAIADAVEGVIP